MDKKEKERLYSNVHPGWWDILDKYVQQILTIAPDAEIYIKEKFGLLRLVARSETIDWKKFMEIETAARLASSTVCEWCGQPGKLRTDSYWLQTLCDRCAHSREDRKLMNSIIEAAKNNWENK